MAEEHASEVAVEAEAGIESAGPGAGAPTELHALLEDARSKADEHWDQCLRLQAELDNLHKRNQRDLENAHKYALEKFAGALLPVRDSLEMGIAVAAQGQNIDPAKLIEGSELTLKMLASALEKFGITEVNPQGERFNPQFHEAMSIQPRADLEPNTVVAVMQKGYLLNDRLIRPAMVIVSKAVPGAETGAGAGVDVRA
ncbi:MAG: nucleotide exchange factor GrpE [Gammaproteobacteria bacterium]|nr:nucleotide exchange factor GrpE [Gammaproteobacteria bacterium]